MLCNSELRFFFSESQGHGVDDVPDDDDDDDDEGHDQIKWKKGFETNTSCFGNTSSGYE